MQSQPEFSTYGRGEQQTVYPLPHKDRSYETVTSAAGSGSSAEPAGYQTDPTSSENSSIDRASPVKPNQPTNDYGIGFSQSPTYRPQAFTVGANPGHQQGGPVGGGQMNGFHPQQRQQQQQQQPQQQHQHQQLQLQQPLQQQQQRLNGKAPAARNYGAPLPPVPQKDPSLIQRRPLPAQTRPEMPEKRKSWFARRFSRAS
jgi:hypothetical protein